MCTNKSYDRIGIFWSILMQNYVYFAISKLPGVKMAILTKFDEKAENFWICSTVKWTGSFMWGSIFDFYWVFSQVLNIINLNMLFPIHFRKFWQFLVFKKPQSWVWIVHSARIFISEHSDMTSRTIFEMLSICNRSAQKFYPKLSIYLCTVFCRPT